MSAKANKRGFFSRLSSDERGNVAIFFGMTIIPAVVLVGGAIDFSRAHHKQQKIQTAADAAVLAAAGMPYGTTNQARQAMAKSVFSANTAGMSITPNATASNTTVSISATTAVPTAFLGLAHIHSISVGANASGRVNYTSQSNTTTTTTQGGGKACILALDPQASDSIQVFGNPEFRFANCWAHSNSTKSDALTGNGNNAVAAGQGTGVVGGSTARVGLFQPNPTTGAQAIPDPFATVGAYEPGAAYQPTFTPPTVNTSVPCKASNLSLKKGTFTLDPGRYCGGINLQAGATVTLNPGVYIIDNGIFNVQSGASITGSNVLFYFYGAAARMTVIGGGTVSLRGRTTGNSYAGFLMIQHPDAWRGLDSNIQGGGNFAVEGMLYFPTQRLLVTGNGTALDNAGSNYLSMVAKSFKFMGNGVFNFKAHSTASNMPDLSPQRVLTTTTTTTQQVVDRVSLQQ